MADLLFSWVANILISIPDTKYYWILSKIGSAIDFKDFSSCLQLKHQDNINCISKYVMIVLGAGVSKEISFEPVCVKCFSCQIEASEIKNIIS